MTVEELLREADPVAEIEIPRPDSPEGRRIKRRALHQQAPVPAPPRLDRLPRRLGPSLGVLGTVAAAVVLLIALLPSTMGPGSSAAAATLSDLAATAGGQPKLGPGQYLYTETEQSPQFSITAGGGSGGRWFSYGVGTEQSWVASDGSGRQVTTTDYNPQFASAADESAWKKAGGTFEEPPRYIVNEVTFGPGGVFLSTNQGYESGNRPTYKVSALPTDPATLAKTLCDSHWKHVPGLSYGWLPPTMSSCQLFGVAALLLQGPDIGSTPALRAALFKVLAGVPGVTLLGKATDAVGRQGIRLRYTEHMPARSIRVTCNGDGHAPTKAVSHLPAGAVTYSLIVDPGSATLLSFEQSFAPFRLDMSSFDACPGAPPTGTQEQIPNRTVLLSSGVVTSTHSVAKGTVEDCASGSIPTPPFNTCQGARDDGDR